MLYPDIILLGWNGLWMICQKICLPLKVVGQLLQIIMNKIWIYKLWNRSQPGIIISLNFSIILYIIFTPSITRLVSAINNNPIRWPSYQSLTKIFIFGLIYTFIKKELPIGMH